MVKRAQISATPIVDKPNKTRAEGDVPAILYGHGTKSQPIKVSYKEFSNVFEQAGYTSLINLSLKDPKDSEKENNHIVLIRETQFHPVTEDLLHIDFYQVKMDKPIRTNVPLIFTGESKAVKDLGGVLVRSIDEIEIEALPKDLIHDIEVDTSFLNDFEKAIHIKDLNLPDTVTIFQDEEDVVALVQPPRTEEELAELSEEVKDEVESVEGVKDKEEEEESPDTDTKEEEKSGGKPESTPPAEQK